MVVPQLHLLSDFNILQEWIWKVLGLKMNFLKRCVFHPRESSFKRTLSVIKSKIKNRYYEILFILRVTLDFLSTQNLTLLPPWQISFFYEFCLNHHWKKKLPSRSQDSHYIVAVQTKTEGQDLLQPAAACPAYDSIQVLFFDSRFFASNSLPSGIH